MDLVRRVNSTYTQVSRNLQILEKENIITIRTYGRFRMVRFNRENPRAEAILKALAILRNTEMKSPVDQNEKRETRRLAQQHEDTESI